MIQVSGVSKSYGKQVLFEDVSFSINPGERIGLIGRNGHGKSTLFRLLQGKEELDAGTIFIPDDYHLGELSQHIHFNKPNVLEEAAEGLKDEWGRTHTVEAILQGLGFSQEQFATDPKLLSGGYQVRLNLVKLLAAEPNLLLLDEPTNYLDIISLRWLERFLKSWRHELMLITHDRSFMNSVITHTMGIHRARVRKLKGTTHNYHEKIEQEELIHEQTRLNQEKKREQVEEFIDRFRAKASKASAVQSRVKQLDKQDRMEKLTEIGTLDFKFNSKDFPGKWILEVKQIAFGYESSEPPLFSGVSFSVGKNDRIGVIGKNGKGKSTLLNVIADYRQPTEGSIVRSGNAAIAYFGQTNVERLTQKNTVEEELWEVDSLAERTRIRGVAGLMMFEGDLAQKRVSVLSGGEKSRVLLGKILLTPANLLLLDEPSNHLDMESTDALLEAIQTFPGAVIMVTHNEMMLHTFAKRLVVFDREVAQVFEGNYQDFLDRVGWGDEESDRQSVEPQARSTNKKELRRIRADILTRRSKELKPLKDRMAILEEGISSREVQIAETVAELTERSKEGFGDDAAKLSRTLHQLKQEVENLFEELSEVSNAHDAKAFSFDKELKELP